MDLIRPSVATALALRRQAVAAGAVGASVLAHCAPEHDLVLTGAAPVIWVGILAIVTPLGARHRWRPRGFGGSLAVMAAA